MATWNVRPADDGAVRRIAQALSLPLAIARILWLRGYQNPSDAEKFMASRLSLDYLRTPLETDGMLKAVKRIKQAVETGEQMVIYGDYDCDGVTSTSLLYRYLKRGLNANVSAYLPDRFKDGYGVTAAAVERLAKQGVSLILTCDNGISAHAAAAAAKAAGIDLVVTDHHQVPEELPDVHAIVHPQVEFPHLKDLAGVGVAYLFAIALEGGFTTRMEHFLDFATIGTVGDVVPLNGPNRPLVWTGIGRYRDGKPRFPGLKALAEVSRTDFSVLSTEDVGFRLVPRLNAAGRLETPDVGFKLLTTNDAAEAAAYAAELDTINAQRKEMSAELQQQINARIDAEWDLEAEPFIVLADEEFHHGITGIIAGRVKEQYRVPVLLFSGHGDGAWKASGRAPEGVHLYEALHAAREHLLGFGGHAGAAGCSANAKELAAVRAKLNQYVRDIGWARPADLVWIDVEVPFSQVDESLLTALDSLEPYGQKNPTPVLGLMRARVVGRRIIKNHLFLKLDDGESVREVVWWGHAEDADVLTDWVKLTFKPRLNTYMGERKVQIQADRIEPTDPPPVVEIVRVAQSAPATITDARDAAGVAPDLSAEGRLAVYALDHGDWPNAVQRLGPQQEMPLMLGEVVLLDLPEDRATLRTLASRASGLTIQWDPAGEDEPAMTPEWLMEFYEALAGQRAYPLAEAAARCGGGYRAAAALRVFRESGLLVERRGFWQLLAAPDDPIALTGLSSYKAAHEAWGFRRHLRQAPIAVIMAEAERAPVAVG